MEGTSGGGPEVGWKVEGVISEVWEIGVEGRRGIKWYWYRIEYRGTAV